MEEEHIGPRANDLWDLLRPKCQENPNGKDSKELDIQVEPRENSELEMGISKSSSLMVFEAVEDEITGGVMKREKV